MRRLVVLYCSAAILVLARIGGPVSASGAKLLSKIPANSRLVVYLPSIRKFDRAFPALIRAEFNGGPASDSRQVLQKALASMGLAGAIDPDGSVVVVVPGNSVGVAMDDVPSIFILTILHRKTFLRAVQGKLLKTGVYRGELDHFDIGMPHTENFVFRFSGRHVICAKSTRVLAKFEHASAWLKPSQVVGWAHRPSPLLAVRINMGQEAFELRSGMMAIIGLRMQLMGRPTKPDIQTLQWEHFANRLINNTKSVAMTLAVRHGVMLGRVQLSPKPASQLAELIAAQHTLSPKVIDSLPLHAYMTAMMEAVNWRALGDYLALSFGRPRKSESATQEKISPKKVWHFPWLLNHSTSAVLVVRRDPSGLTHHTAEVLAHMDSHIDMSAIRSHIRELIYFLPSGNSSDIKIGAVGPHGVRLELGKSGAGSPSYLINSVGGRTFLLAPSRSFRRLAGELLRRRSAISATRTRLLRKMLPYLPTGLIAVQFFSARAADAGAPKAAAGALAFTVHHRPAMLAISRHGSRLDINYFVPMTIWRHAGSFYGF